MPPTTTTKTSSKASRSKECLKRREIAETRDFLSVSYATCIVISTFTVIMFIAALWLLIAAATHSSIFATTANSAQASRFVNFIAKNNTAKASKFTRTDIRHMERQTLNQSSGHRFEIPEYAIRLSSDQYYIGEREFKGRGRVKGFINIYRAKVSPNETTTTAFQEIEPDYAQEIGEVFGICSSLLAEGTRWKGAAEPFSIGYFNPFGITAQQLEDAIEESMCTWQSELNFPIFGKNNAATLANGPDYNGPDGKNEIQFGFIADSGVLAATTIWGIFDGPVESRYILESDLLFNERQAFTLDGSANTYSLKNILAHELGHWIGLGDVYDAACKDVTMYGYASKGETKKITLSKTDSDAIRELYGETNAAFPTNAKCVSPFAGSAGDTGVDAPKTSDASSSQNQMKTVAFNIAIASIFIHLISF